jgi:thiosulfate dehydrogenase
LLVLLPAGAAAGPSPPYHLPPSLDALPADKFGGLVRLGYAIVSDTPKYAGRYVGNGLSCRNCHLDNGRKPNAAPFWAAWGVYPAWRAKNNRVNSFELRVQECFRYALNGTPPAPAALELQAISAYAYWLAQGVPVGQELPGRGFPLLAKTGQDPSPDRGRQVYIRACASCHGADGEGKEAVPPVWGMRSFNKGAGMHHVPTAAAFIKANMPLGTPTLSDQEALDAAAYINAQVRPMDPRQGWLGFFDP